MKFVRAERKDKAEILALYRSLVGTECCAWTCDYPGDEDIEGDLARDGLFCMKDDKGEIVGVISIDQDDAVESLPCWKESLKPGAELSRLGVRIADQNQGIARKLLQHGMDELRRREMKSVHFIVCKSNQKAIRSYNRLDFDLVGECRMYGEEWWCYEKSL
ncbi:MAG: GNAT family N-acetyltransferase [Lachnospiraceae bacterium]|nr:GNAT family N-acetyltransferase [Lachnospiraceae bacterium]MDE6185860.1 GNAT family N-acetyltransferase [Lachnospiraceae bacterium]MDE7286182.1 GNAT family N-acetyltransferase [Lachnospiraceae bacterium]